MVVKQYAYADSHLSPIRWLAGTQQPRQMIGSLWLRSCLSDIVTWLSRLVFTARRYASAVLAVVVCPSVTSRHCTKTAKHRITQTTPYDSPNSQTYRHADRNTAHPTGGEV